ncbi:MAG: nicotinamide riboside transporter PnuC [Candidatus Falkowbacteria bacterium]
MDFFNINTTIFTVIGYPMSYLEFFGTILNLLSVYLVARNNIWSWPVGNIAVVLFAVLFFQIRLYSDFMEQIYFFITGFYGWWIWLKLKKKDARKEDDAGVSGSSGRSLFIYTAGIFIGTIVLGYLMSHIHEWLPRLFSEPASFAYLDAFTTILSFAATILMAHKKFECWYLWILVDIIGIGLYFAKDVVFISLLYAVFLVLASRGLLGWKKAMKYA